MDKKEIIQHMKSLSHVRLNDMMFNEILGERWEEVTMPRRIAPPNGYLSPKHWWGHYGLKIAYPILMGKEYETPERKRDAEMFKYSGTVLRKADGPTFFLSDDLIDALDRTDVENSMPMEELEWPHEGILFVLPTARKFAEISGVFAMNSYITMFSIIRVDHVQYGKSYIVTFLDSESVTSHAHYPCHGTYGEQLAEHGEYFNRDDPAKAFLEEFGVEVTPNQLEWDKWQNGEVVRLAWKVLCAMNATNAVVRIGGGIAREARVKKGKSRPALWNPTILDLGERIQTEGESVVGGKVRYHWRRGHFRRQVCGVGRMERKTLWIKPCTVGSI